LRTIDVGNYKLTVLDTYEDSVRNILQELPRAHFRVFHISCYSPRNIRGNIGHISMHAYAAAIDLNPRQNPYIDAVNHTIIPAPDRNNCSENEDFYINRGILREGMITPKVVDIFAKNGFTIWGGNWGRPIDYMHFQTTKVIAVIIGALSPYQAKIFWNYYLKNPRLISQDKFFASSHVDREEIVLDKLLSRMDIILKGRLMYQR
jgi:hypothetical protein